MTLAQKQWRERNKAHLQASKKAYWAAVRNDPVRHAAEIARKKKYRRENKTKLAASWQRTYAKLKSRPDFTERNTLKARRYFQKHPEKMKAKRRTRYLLNRDHELALAKARPKPAGWHKKVCVYQSNRRKTDIHFRLKQNLRTRLNQALRRKSKAGSAVRDLGCTVDEFRKHIERQFVRGMTWENYGTKWHLDHITPLAIFDLTNREQFAVAAHFTNYQPLWVLENLSKGAAIEKALSLESSASIPSNAGTVTK